MTNWWLFPPVTQEVQMDEKWSFVSKKQENCDGDNPADGERGDCWDHVAIDAESRLVLSVVPGKRTAENCRELVSEVRRRMGGRLPRLITTDEYPSYAVAIHEVYGCRVVPLVVLPKRRGRPRVNKKVVPEALNYAVVHKYRKEGQVVKVQSRVVFGTEESVAAALGQSTASSKVNTAFLERQNGTDRHRNARKARCTCCFSKDLEMHEAMTYFTMYSYNFCWPVRTLACKDANGVKQPRTPAMLAGLSDHVWTMAEWAAYPVTQ
jgi:IS1 family transposase